MMNDREIDTGLGDGAEGGGGGLAEWPYTFVVDDLRPFSVFDVKVGVSNYSNNMDHNSF